MNIFKKIEKAIIWSLIIFLVVLLVFSTLDIVYQIYIKITESEKFIPDVNMLVEFFGMFLVILIGIELLETIKAYLKDDVVHVEIVILVAIIAIARKVIVLDYDKIEPITLIGMAILVIALGGTYYLIKNIDSKYPFKSRQKEKEENQ